MKFQEIFEKVTELKSLYQEFFKQRKQMSAIDNYRIIHRFNEEEQKIFAAIRFCMKGSFLKKKDMLWLESTLEEFQINYLDWAHRTKWVKDQLAEVKVPADAPRQLYFDLLNPKSNMKVPPEVVSLKQAIKASRI